MGLRQGDEPSQTAQKRLFVGLLSISLVLLFLCAGMAWWVVLETGNIVNRIIVMMLLVLMAGFFILMSVGLVVMIWSIWREREIQWLQFVIRSAVHVLYPFALGFGRLFGAHEDWIKNSFVQVSNHMVKTRIRGRGAERILMLVPHCIQWSECPHKITIQIENCQECGRCMIGSLKRMAAETGACLAVATGGTVARSIIKAYRPQGVVAIACERDLTSGIRDMRRFDVLGVLNERPNGPCHNTCVDLKQVGDAVRYFREGR